MVGFCANACNARMDIFQFKWELAKWDERFFLHSILVCDDAKVNCVDENANVKKIGKPSADGLTD